MNHPVVDVVEVSKSYGPTTVLHNITLSIKEGEFFSLLGPSGCGKTTLLRMIAGFEFPTQGKLCISGENMEAVPAYLRPVNMVFQSYALFPHMTVADNVAFGLRLRKTPAAEIKQKVKEALELVRLPHVAERYPRQISGGQQQRIAFARAIVNRPQVLLLDEPLSALDPKIREEMQDELSRFKRELGTTFVMVTHDQNEAFALSDRIAIFSAGHLEQVDVPEVIYDNPKTAFVADFVGDTNIFSGLVVEVSDKLVVMKMQDGSMLSTQLDPGEFVPQVGDDAKLWVRSDMIDVGGDHEGAANGAVNLVPVTVSTRAYAGTNYELRLKTESGSIFRAILPRERAHAHEPGEHTTMRIPFNSINILEH